MRTYSATITLTNIVNQYGRTPESEDSATHWLTVQLQDHNIDSVQVTEVLICDACEDEVQDVRTILDKDYCDDCLEDVGTHVSITHCTSCQQDTPQVEVSQEFFGSFDVCVVCQTVQ